MNVSNAVRKTFLLRSLLLWRMFLFLFDIHSWEGWVWFAKISSPHWFIVVLVIGFRRISTALLVQKTRCWTSWDCWMKALVKQASLKRSLTHMIRSLRWTGFYIHRFHTLPNNLAAIKVTAVCLVHAWCDVWDWYVHVPLVVIDLLTLSTILMTIHW